METPPRKQPKIVSVSLSSPIKSKSSKKSSKSSSPKKNQNSNMKNSPPHNNSSPPKTLSPNKSTTGNSHPKMNKQNPNKFNMNLRELKKTFKGSENVFEKIGEENCRKQVQVKKKKRQQELIKKEKQQEINEKGPAKLTNDQFYVCKELFKVLDKNSRNYTTVDDLQELKAMRKLQEILKIVYIRKNISTFFDFVYALWQSGQIFEVMQALEIQSN